MRIIFRKRTRTSGAPEGPARGHLHWGLPGQVGDQEVHGKVLAVDESVHNISDVRRHDVGVHVAVVFVVESSPSQHHTDEGNVNPNM